MELHQSETKQQPKGSSCLLRFTFIALTSLIAFQTLYNFTGAMELGGKYMQLPMLTYKVGSLVPALFLGIYACKVTCANNSDQLLKNSCVYVIIARIYVGIFVLVALLLPFSGYIASLTDQLAMQNLKSVRNMLFWMAKYWVFSQYLVSFLLSVLFLRKVKSKYIEQKRAVYDEL